MLGTIITIATFTKLYRVRTFSAGNSIKSKELKSFDKLCQVLEVFDIRR